MPDLGDFDRTFIEQLAAADATAGDRALYANNVGGGWLLLGAVALLAMLPLAGVGQLAAGKDGRMVGAAIAMGMSFFCAAGSFYGAWCWQYGLRARRLERRGKTAFRRYRRYLDRSRPRDSSLVVQAVVGISAGIIAVTSL